MLPPGAPKRAVFSETAKVTPVFSIASAWCLIHPPAPGLAGAIRLAPLGNLSRLVNPASDGNQDKSYLRWCCACRLHCPARRAAHLLSFLWCYRNHGFCLTSRLLALLRVAYHFGFFGDAFSGYTVRRVVLCFVCLAFTFCIWNFYNATLLLARPGDQPVWGLHTPCLCSGYRILTDATVGSLWTGVSLCAVYLRLQAHVKGRLYRQPPAIFQGLASLF